MNRYAVEQCALPLDDEHAEWRWLILDTLTGDYVQTVKCETREEADGIIREAGLK